MADEISTIDPQVISHRAEDKNLQLLCRLSVLQSKDHSYLFKPQQQDTDTGCFHQDNQAKLNLNSLDAFINRCCDLPLTLTRFQFDGLQTNLIITALHVNSTKETTELSTKLHKKLDRLLNLRLCTADRCRC